MGISPFRISDIVKDHPNWLYPQTDPALATDPATNPNDPEDPYVGKYLNISGFPTNYVINTADPDCQKAWAETVITKAKAIGVDGILIDEYGILRLFRDGVQRTQAQCQQFIHAVVPKLRAAGLTTLVLNGVANLDGSSSWNGGIAQVIFDPFWAPTAELSESNGYTANTVDNTPDVFFREYSFLSSKYIYSSEYWLKCIQDADIVAGWNAKLSASQTKKTNILRCAARGYYRSSGV